MIGRVEFLALSEPHVTANELERIEAAYTFSKYAHQPQVRDSGERYFEHPKAVALILVVELEIHNPDLIVLALLHDVVEDSWLLSNERVRINFGSHIAEWLEFVTKRDGKDYEAELQQAPWQALFVKMADRLHNLRTLDGVTPEKHERKLIETREHYLPLADRLVAKAPQAYKPATAWLREQIGDLCDPTLR